MIDDVLSQKRCDEVAEQLPVIGSSGSRVLLNIDCFRELAEELRSGEKMRDILETLVAVQCTYFRKTEEHNWSIRLHRDRVVPVKGSGPWDSSGEKEGMSCARPPREFQDQCVAVRLSLDDALEGDFLVVLGSHQSDNKPTREDAISVPVRKGGALVMRPSLLHGSTKLKAIPSRRVLHVLYAPVQLPGSYQWYHAV